MVCVSSSVDSQVVSISKTSASFVITRMVELICLESAQSVLYTLLCLGVLVKTRFAAKTLKLIGRYEKGKPDFDVMTH